MRYVVGGSIRRSGDMLRISVQLSDTETGVLLWSAKYDEPAGELFELQDRISRAIVGALAIRVSQVEHQRTAARPTSDLSAYHLVLRGRALMHVPERDRYLDARSLFQDAIAIDPGYADALVALGSTYTADVYWGWTEFTQAALQQAEDYARRAVGIDPENAGAHALLAEVLRLQGDNDRAQAEIRRALELNPNSAFANGIRGNLLLLAGDYERAIPVLELALRLDPNLSSFFVADLGVSFYLLGRFEEAVDRLEAVMDRVGEDPAPHAVLAASLARLGRQEAAEATAREVLRLYPFFDVKNFSGYFGNSERLSPLLEGLRAAGLD